MVKFWILAFLILGMMSSPAYVSANDDPVPAAGNENDGPKKDVNERSYNGLFDWSIDDSWWPDTGKTTASTTQTSSTTTTSTTKAPSLGLDSSKIIDCAGSTSRKCRNRRFLGYIPLYYL